MRARDKIKRQISQSMLRLDRLLKAQAPKNRKKLHKLNLKYFYRTFSRASLYKMSNYQKIFIQIKESECLLQKCLLKDETCLVPFSSDEV